MEGYSSNKGLRFHPDDWHGWGEFLQGFACNNRTQHVFFCLPSWQNKMRGSVNFYHFLKWFPPLWEEVAGNITSGPALGPMSSWLTWNWIIEPYWMYCMCTYVLIMIGENKGPSCTLWIMHCATIHRSMIQLLPGWTGTDGWMDGVETYTDEMHQHPSEVTLCNMICHNLAHTGLNIILIFSHHFNEGVFILIHCFRFNVFSSFYSVTPPALRA